LCRSGGINIDAKFEKKIDDCIRRGICRKKYKEISKDFFLLKLPKEKKYAHYKAGKE